MMSELGTTIIAIGLTIFLLACGIAIVISSIKPNGEK